MRVLFIHQNFPGQYLHLARRLRDEGHVVVGIGEARNIRNRGVIDGITTIGYPTPEGAGEKTHHYLKSTEAAVRRGQAVARSLLELKGKGFTPDVISLHPGWGEGLFVREVYPDAPTLMFCEFFFRAGEADLAFDPEFSHTPDWEYSVRIRNTPQIMSLLCADACIAPTAWQASRYPAFLRERMHIIHDGVDTDFMRPDPCESLTIQPLEEPGESRIPGVAPPPGRDGGQSDPGTPRGEPLTFTRDSKVITYIARNLEPYRGYHVFLRVLPELQRRHPDAHVLIVGSEGTSYSPALPGGESYKTRYLSQVRDRLDLTRVHFLGRIPYASLRAMYRISSAHVYLTYPFVLSWSVLEAMACECLVVASGTEPVREVMTDGKNALLVDFFDAEALADRLDAALTGPERFDLLRKGARERVLGGFALGPCLTAQAALLADLASGRAPAGERNCVSI